MESERVREKEEKGYRAMHVTKIKNEASVRQSKRV